MPELVLLAWSKLPFPEQAASMAASRVSKLVCMHSLHRSCDQA